MAEERIGEIVIGRAEIGVVKNIEKLSPEPQVQLLSEPKLSLERHVRLRCSESAQHVASEITLLSARGWSKCRRVENLATRILRAKKLKRLSWHNIRTGVDCGASGNNERADDSNRGSRAGENERVHRPSAQRGPSKPVRLRGGQSIGHARREGMPDIKIGIPAVDVWICDKAWRVQKVGKCIGGGNVYRM